MFYMVAMTIILSPVLVFLYRRAVRRLMRLSWHESKQAKSETDRDKPTALTVAHSGGGQSPAPDLMRRIATRRTHVAIAYGVAGACYAAVLTAIFAARHWDILSRARTEASLRMVSLAALMFCLPTLLTLLHLYSVSLLRKSFAVLAIMAGIYVLAGPFADVASAFFSLHLLIPLTLFLILNLRFWRGIAPLTMVVMTPVAIGAIVSVFAWGAIGAPAEHVWLGRLLGAAVGALLGYAGLITLARLHDAGKLSGQELFLDCWWLLFTVYQTGVWSMDDPIYLFTLTSFLVYALVKRLLMKWLLPPAPDEVIPNLLLLRVFGFDRRTEQLFDQLTPPWRLIGSVSLIIAPDIAMRGIAPPDYAAFLIGRLWSRFNRDASALAREISTGLANPAPDGTFPLHQLLCMSNTWQPVMRALGTSSDAVIIDLRGFTGDRQGCRIELEYLAATAPNKPVVLLADSASDTLLIRQIIEASQIDSQLRLPESWLLVADASNTRQAAQRAIAHVAEQLSSQGPRAICAASN